MKNVEQTIHEDQRELAELAEQARILSGFAAELTRKVSALERTAAPVRGIDLRRVSVDEMLDAWQEARGARAEAHLLSRIYRRRAARRGASL